MENKGILLTGASGFLGSYVHKALMNQVEKPVLACYHHRIPENASGQWLCIDLLNPSEVEEILPKIDTIIHLAGKISYQKKDRDSLRKSNMHMTRELVNSALAFGVKNFILMSSASTMAKSIQPLVFTDKPSSSPVFHSYYARTKFESELEVRRGEAEGLQIAILNPSLILGTGDWSKGSPSVIARIATGLPAYPAGSLGLVGAEDVANVVVKIVKEELWGKQLMLNAETWTYQKFIYTICEMLNRKPPQYRSNGILSNLAVLKDTLLSRLQKKQNIITGETAFMSAQSFSYGCGWSNQLANLKYQPVEAVLKKMINEYINK
ncbi:MAG: NAD-dependent epimerase/dehydratase family protein [Saprospiraceae bacterium]|nr:NAD-dependent epimerase/dehydratase family protein [Candidatus Vicinibacter affinis]